MCGGEIGWVIGAAVDEWCDVVDVGVGHRFCFGLTVLDELWGYVAARADALSLVPR